MAKIKSKLKKEGKVKTTLYGQWEYPGEITRIPSGDITMQGVNYPVYGIDDLGYSQMMYPGMNYTYPGSSVTEYPIMQQGGRAPIIVNNPNDPRLQAYQDSLDLYNFSNQQRIDNLLRQGFRYDTNNNKKVNNVFNERKKQEWQKAFKVNPKKGLQKIIQSGNDGKIDNSTGGNYDTKAQYELMHGKIAPVASASLYDAHWRNNEYLYDYIDENGKFSTLGGHDFDRNETNFRKNPYYKEPLAIDKKGKVIRNFFEVPIYQKPVQPIIYQSDFEIAQNPNPTIVIPSTTQKYQALQEQPIKIESKQADLLQTNPLELDFNPIPFTQGTYFTRERQSQEQDSKQFGRKGKKDYFDKKTGKLLGTYGEGGKTKNPTIKDKVLTKGNQIQSYYYDQFDDFLKNNYGEPEVEPRNTWVDALRHAGTSMYMTSGQGKYAAPFKIPYTNLMGLAHELQYFDPSLQGIKETSSDLYNNFIGSVIGGLPIDIKKKEELLKSANKNNILSVLETPEEASRRMFEIISKDDKSRLIPKGQSIPSVDGFEFGGKTNDWEIVEEFADGGKYLTVDGEHHRVYRNADGDIMVNHPKENKGKWDTINLTKESDANTIAEGVASVRKWHRENPYAFGGNIILEKYDNGGSVWQIVDDNQWEII